MDQKRIILIGGSAGSLQVIFKIFSDLETPYAIPVVIILHRSQGIESGLEELLQAKTGLPVKEIEEKEKPEPGWLYLCPPDYHLLFEDDESFTIDYSEKVNFCRPSLDVCFQSAADIYGSSLVCILLSGANSDGAEGLVYVKEKGGVTIVQDPQEAEVPYMPQQALQRQLADHVLSSVEIRSYLESLR
jgi:two-component system, chemotaxis family, protein-glutamate methylesterase/glutaminase